MTSKCKHNYSSFRRLTPVDGRVHIATLMTTAVVNKWNWDHFQSCGTTGTPTANQIQLNSHGCQSS